MLKVKLFSNALKISKKIKPNFVHCALISEGGITLHTNLHHIFNEEYCKLIGNDDFIQEKLIHINKFYRVMNEKRGKVIETITG